MNNSPRERLVQTTASLLQSQGYNSTGLNQILQQSEAPKGSLYHYFPGGKEELAIAAIEHATREVSTALQSRIGQQRNLKGALLAVIDFFIGELESSQFTKGCPVATIALEQAGVNLKIQAACENAYQTWQTGLAQMLGAYGVGQPLLQAERLLVLLEGATLLSRVRRNCAPLRQLKTDFPILLQTGV